MNRYVIWSVERARSLRTSLTYFQATRLADRYEAIFHQPVLVMEA